MLLVMALFTTGCWRDEVPRRSMVGGAPVAPSARPIDGDTVLGDRHFVRGYPARNADGSVNAVIEIPAGTTAKFDVGDDGLLRWARDRYDGSRREIDYLPYPVNYGMVPGTLAPDGDALDVFVLGRGIERAHVGATRIIGVLEMAHDGTRDDKLVAVALEPGLRNGFSSLRDLDELDRRYPATRIVLELWFAHYWGPGATEVVGWGDAAVASTILDEAIERFTHRAAVHTARHDRAGLHPRAAPPCVARARSPMLRALHAMFDSAC